MLPRNEVVTKVITENQTYYKIQKKSRSRSRRANRSITTATKNTNEANLLDSKDYNLLAMSNNNPMSLFGKLRSPNSPKSSKDFISDKSKIQKLRFSSKGSLERKHTDLTGSYAKFSNDNSYFKKKKIKNMRYMQSKEEDSEDLDIPNENIKELSSVSVSQDQDDS